MYGGSANLPVRRPELEEQAKIRRDLNEIDDSISSDKDKAEPKTIHVHLRGTLGKFKANPEAAVWEFVQKGAGIQGLSNLDENGGRVGDTRRAFVTSAKVSNQGSNFQHGEISFDIDAFPRSMVNTATTQTGSIHPGVVNQPLDLLSKVEKGVDTANLELLNLTEEQVEKCFFEVTMPNGETWQAVHKDTPAARAVVLKDNCKRMMAVLQQEYRAKHGSLDGWVKPYIYCDFGESSPVITMSRAYYDFAKHSAKEFAKKQQVISDKIFTNLHTLDVKFAPSGMTWSALADEVTEGMSQELKQKVLDTPFYMSFNLTVEYSLLDGLNSSKIKTESSTTPA